MTLDPTRFATWTAMRDHPIFGTMKYNIADWSLEPSRYGELDHYRKFMPESYVHVTPTLSVDEQQQIAQRDIANLALACEQLQRVFGKLKYELVILDDFTAYAWVQIAQYTLEMYPNPDLKGTALLKLFIEASNSEVSEYDCHTISELTNAVCRAVGSQLGDSE